MDDDFILTMRKIRVNVYSAFPSSVSCLLNSRYRDRKLSQWQGLNGDF